MVKKINTRDAFLGLEKKVITMAQKYQKSDKLDLGEYANLRLEIVNSSRKLNNLELRRLVLIFENLDRAITAQETDQFRKNYVTY